MPSGEHQGAANRPAASACDGSLPALVLWFTGLSGAGKTTLADLAAGYLRGQGYKVELLDGDIVRSIFPQTGFTKEERDSHIQRVGYLASVLERNGIIVLASFVSPYRGARHFVRGLCRNFHEIYVQSSLEACEARDVKGLYKKARAGAIPHFTGISDPYEAPEQPELLLTTDQETVGESFAKLRMHIDRQLSGRIP